MTENTGIPRPSMLYASRELIGTTLKQLSGYFALTFAISWGFLLPGLAFAPANLQIFFIITMAFGPALAAAVLTWRTASWRGLRTWLGRLFNFRIPTYLFLAGGVLLPLGFGMAQDGLYRLFGGGPAPSLGEAWYMYPFYLIPTALLSGGNEEPGWRGYALPRLLRHFKPIPATIILGVIHAAWHLPLMAQYETTFGWYLFNLIPLTFLLNWFYLESNGSIIPVMLLHAGTNVIGAFIPTPDIVLSGVGTEMVLRGIVYWGIAISLIVFTRGQLGWEPGDRGNSGSSEQPIADAAMPGLTGSGGATA